MTKPWVGLLVAATMGWGTGTLLAGPVELSGNVEANALRSELGRLAPVSAETQTMLVGHPGPRCHYPSRPSGYYGTRRPGYGGPGGASAAYRYPRTYFYGSGYGPGFTPYGGYGSYGLAPGAYGRFGTGGYGAYGFGPGLNDGGRGLWIGF